MRRLRPTTVYAFDERGSSNRTHTLAHAKAHWTLNRHIFRIAMCDESGAAATTDTQFFTHRRANKKKPINFSTYCWGRSTYQKCNGNRPMPYRMNRSARARAHTHFVHVRAALSQPKCWADKKKRNVRQKKTKDSRHPTGIFRSCINRKNKQTEQIYGEFDFRRSCYFNLSTHGMNCFRSLAELRLEIGSILLAVFFFTF